MDIVVRANLDGTRLVVRKTSTGESVVQLVSNKLKIWQIAGIVYTRLSSPIADRNGIYIEVRDTNG